MARRTRTHRADRRLAPGPVRPGIRYGVEQEGPNVGITTVVVLGNPPWREVTAAVKDKQPGHVFWEWGKGQSSWVRVRQILRRVTYVTVEVDADDVRHLPPRIPRRVTVMVRVPRAWLKAGALKINLGGFRVLHASFEWATAVPKDYEKDVQIWP